MRWCRAQSGCVRGLPDEQTSNEENGEDNDDKVEKIDFEHLLGGSLVFIFHQAPSVLPL